MSGVAQYPAPHWFLDVQKGANGRESDKSGICRKVGDNRQMKMELLLGQPDPPERHWPLQNVDRKTRLAEQNEQRVCENPSFSAYTCTAQDYGSE